LPKLRSSKTASWTPVLEIVSSGLYRTVVVPTSAVDAPLELYNKPNDYNGRKQYNASKLFVQCAIKQLAELAQPNGAGEPEVIVLGICPGACKSELGRELLTSFVIRFFVSIFFALFCRTTEQGSRLYVSGTAQGAKANGLAWKEDTLQP
jgi:NAD(P)-dependent dehydrogenase (short-subunit alcohol dehydrogenase family)